MIQYMSRPILDIRLKPEERSELNRRVRSPKTSQRDYLRARIILLRAAGKKQQDVADELGVSHVIVSKWTRRFMQNSLVGLNDAKGRGRKSSLSTKKVETIITKATQPPEGRVRWSVRTMAKEAGVSSYSVHKIWRANQIKPHLTKTFKVSNDPLFEEKFWDIIGLYLDPPLKALVFCCDEKSQCQALERTQPGLPLGIGHIRTKTHDYIRHGTTTLFAALDYLEGKVIKRTEARHTHVEWLRFLKQINRETPQELDIHLIVDNYCTHKHEKVKQWLEKHPRFYMHLTPTSSSWLNLVERFFADITQECIRDGSFESVPRLEKAIHTYIDERNKNPIPYRWVADGVSILEKINRARKKLNKPIYKTAH
jgi:transposase